MNIRLRTLWRVPVFCLAAGWLSFYVTLFLGRFFFAVQTEGSGGALELSVDPFRSALFHGVLFLLLLFAGGFLLFRSMSRTEIAVSAALISAFYLILLLLQLYWPGFPPSVSLHLVPFQNWTADLAACLTELTGQSLLSTFLSAFSPFLFVPFGRYLPERENPL